MNFLAHLYLSGDNPEIMVGNFMGDFVRGRDLLSRFSPGISLGIELHRGIDEFTDSHEIVAQSKNRLRPKYRHYAAVIVDIFYDHYLARNWNEHHPEPLPAYAEKIYALMAQYNATLPPDAIAMMPYMISGNWLVNYAKIEGIGRALSGMSRRTKFDSKMDESIHELNQYYDDFKKEFDLFFPALKNFSRQFIIDQNIKDL